MGPAGAGVHGTVKLHGTSGAEQSRERGGESGRRVMTSGPGWQRERCGMLGPSASGGRALRAEQTGPPGKERSGPGKELIDRWGVKEKGILC